MFQHLMHTAAGRPTARLQEIQTVLDLRQGDRFPYTQKVGRAPEPAQGVCPASLRSSYRMPFTPYNFYEVACDTAAR